MKLTKKALTIIDMQQYRAYGLGYMQAITDMQRWLTTGIPNVVMSELERLAARTVKSLDAMNEAHYKDVSENARTLLSETHELLGVGFDG